MTDKAKASRLRRLKRVWKDMNIAEVIAADQKREAK